MSNSYPLERSPFYKLKSRRKLAGLLGMPSAYFSKTHDYKYHSYSKQKPNGDGVRNYSLPPVELKHIQRRICKLLMRIEKPEWVISGRKGCSYITNAEQHTENAFIQHMDISQFYDSVDRGHVFRLFLNIFKMPEDIAWIMTDLVMYNGNLPTGSPSSQMIAYWAYSNMFESINYIAIGRSCKFTLYVDDMTFSSDTPISHELIEDVTKELRKNGLVSKIRKNHYYQADKFKLVTGVGIKDGKKVVLNSKRKKLLEQFKKCKISNDISDIERLKGMLCALRQIEPDIFPEIENYIQHYENQLHTLAMQRSHIYAKS